MEHLNEPLQHMYRPASCYACIEFLCWIGHRALCGAGFQQHALNGITYYTRPASPAFIAAARERQVRIKGPPGHGHGTRHALLHPSPDSPKAKAASAGIWRWCWPAGQRRASKQAAVQLDSSVPLPDAGSAEDVQLVPLVMLHGVGMGLVPYLRLIFALAATGVVTECRAMAACYGALSLAWACTCDESYT